MPEITADAAVDGLAMLLCAVTLTTDAAINADWQVRQ